MRNYLFKATMLLASALTIMLAACGGPASTRTASPTARPQSTASQQSTATPVTVDLPPTEARPTAPAEATETAPPRPTQPPATSTPLPQPDAENLQVVARREVVVEVGSRILSLSPDGGSLLVWKKPGVLCINDAASAKEKLCAKLKSRKIDLRSVAWSPDSARVAYTENVYQYLYESDIWVMEVETGKLTNLTDDEVEGNFLEPESSAKKAQLDAIPAWSPDGKTLVFARTAGPRRETALYTVPAVGGKPKKLVTVAREEPFTVWYNMRWSDDGQHIYYAVRHVQKENPENGIWVVRSDGRDPRQLLRSDPERDIPLLIGMWAGGSKAVVYYEAAAYTYASGTINLWEVVDLRTGAARPVREAPKDTSQPRGPDNVVLSPDGFTLLYVERTAGGARRLIARNVAGGSDRVLLTDQGEGYFGAYGGNALGLAWAENNSVYVGVAPGSGILLRLGTK